MWQNRWFFLVITIIVSFIIGNTWLNLQMSNEFDRRTQATKEMKRFEIPATLLKNDRYQSRIYSAINQVSEQTKIPIVTRHSWIKIKRSHWYKMGVIECITTWRSNSWQSKKIWQAQDVVLSQYRVNYLNDGLQPNDIEVDRFVKSHFDHEYELFITQLHHNLNNMGISVQIDDLRAKESVKDIWPVSLGLPTACWLSLVVTLLMSLSIMVRWVTEVRERELRTLLGESILKQEIWLFGSALLIANLSYLGVRYLENQSINGLDGLILIISDVWLLGMFGLTILIMEHYVVKIIAGIWGKVVLFIGLLLVTVFSLAFGLLMLHSLSIRPATDKQVDDDYKYILCGYESGNRTVHDSLDTADQYVSSYLWYDKVAPYLYQFAKDTVELTNNRLSQHFQINSTFLKRSKLKINGQEIEVNELKQPVIWTTDVLSAVDFNNLNNMNPYLTRKNIKKVTDITLTDEKGKTQNIKGLLQYTPNDLMWGKNYVLAPFVLNGSQDFYFDSRDWNNISQLQKWHKKNIEASYLADNYPIPLLTSKQVRLFETVQSEQMSLENGPLWIIELLLGFVGLIHLKMLWRILIKPRQKVENLFKLPIIYRYRHGLLLMIGLPLICGWIMAQLTSADYMFVLQYAGLGLFIACYLNSCYWERGR